MATFKKYKNKRTGKERYAFKIYLGTDPVTGRRIQTTRRGFETKAAAKSACAKLELEYQRDGWKNDQNEIKKFSELFDVWFQSYEKTVKQSSATDAWWKYKRYIASEFGSLKLESISVPYCQKYVNKLSKKYREYRSIKNLVAQILNYAVSLELIDSNHMKKIIIPHSEFKPLHKKEENFYNKDELNYFFDCLKKIGDQRYIAFFRLLAFTGIRKSEALALQWKDVDFKNSTITIKKTIYFDSRQHKVIIQAPKTKTSKRVLDVDATTLLILKKWHLEQHKKYLVLGYNTLNKDQFLFTQVGNNQLLIPNRVNDWLKWIYKKYPQKNITVHGFRHTHASLLFESGATIKEVQDRLGHSNVKTTMDIYTHVTKAAKKDTANKFANYIDN